MHQFNYKTQQPHHTQNYQYGSRYPKSYHPTHMTPLQNFFKNNINPKTRIIHAHPPYDIRLYCLETLLQTGLTLRARKNPAYLPNPFEINIINTIISTKANINNPSTFNGTPLQSIFLLQKENIFLPRSFYLACVTHFITPIMITRYDILRLLHYAYILALFPHTIHVICKTPTVDLRHDYYKDLFNI